MLSQRTPVTGEEWHPFFERALKEYVLEQEGHMTIINVRNLLSFMRTHKGYPMIETDEDAQKVSKFLNKYYRDFFGRTWDGVKYRDNPSRGKSLFMGTENLQDLIRYNRTVP